MMTLVGRRKLVYALAFAPLAMLLALALACTGGDTYQVQEPVNDTRVEYESWLGDMGATDGYGPPYITTPDVGAELSGSVEVKGWAVKNVDGAVVHVYAAPRSDATEDSLLAGYEIGQASVETSTGEWAFSTATSAFATGSQCTLAARTEIPGRGMSPFHRVNVTVTGAQKPTPRAAKETIDLVCVMVETNDGDLTTDAKSRADTTVEEVASYWRHVSHGNLAVGTITWVYTDEPLTVNKAGLDDGTTEAIVTDGKVAAALRDACSASDNAVSLIAFLPPAKGGPAGRSYGWPRARYFSEGVAGVIPDDRRGSAVQVFSYNVMVIAHELAHGLGTSRKSGTTENDATWSVRSQLPDLYHAPSRNDWEHVTFWTDEANVDYFGFSDYSNIHTSYPRAGYFLMAQGNGRDKFVATPCAFSQEWLGWLSWDTHEKDTSAQVSVPNLSRAQTTLTQAPRFRWTQDKRESYVVLEGRTFLNEYRVGGNTKRAAYLDWTADGVVMYKIRALVEDEKEKSEKGPLYPRSIDYLRTLTSSAPTCVDIGDRYTARLAQGSFDGGADTVQVSWKPVKTRDYYTPPLGLGSAGALMRPTLPSPGFSTTLAAPESLAAPSADSSPTQGLDLDLHAYLSDGGHIGLNYETGEYENPLPEALVSGDRSMDAEWILLPPEMAGDVEFVVSSPVPDSDDTSASVSLAEIPLAYTVEAAAYDESAVAASFSAPQEGTLTPGQRSSTKVTVSETSLEILPVSKPRTEPRMADAASTANWRTPALLGGSALLLLGGLALLLWPKRKRA